MYLAEYIAGIIGLLHLMDNSHNSITFPAVSLHHDRDQEKTRVKTKYFQKIRIAKALLATTPGTPSFAC